MIRKKAELLRQRYEFGKARHRRRALGNETEARQQQHLEPKLLEGVEQHNANVFPSSCRIRYLFCVRWAASIAAIVAIIALARGCGCG